MTNRHICHHFKILLDNWCAEINRDPGEIERSTGTQKFATDAQREEYVKAGATHLILGMGEPWDFDAVKDLIRWRDTHSSSVAITV